ncbi:MAG: hypothetical protein ACO2PN_21220 [Pyrobaculum sp.]|jgi:hypothetical protein
MSCGELLRQFVESLDSGEVDFRPLRRLFSRCGDRAPSAVKKAVYFAVRKAWEYYKDSPNPKDAYVQMIFFIWNLGSWHYMPCRTLTEVITYVAKAVSKYSWPARWPLLAMAAAAAEERGCGIPKAVAEALGPDDYKMLKAFLEKGRGVVEAAGRRIAVVKKKRHITIEDYRDKTEK